jgi:protocatechuate 3,4-dioxygenase beta subunit
VEIVLPGPDPLEVTVVDTAGRPVPGAEILVSRRSVRGDWPDPGGRDARVAVATTDGDGRASLTGLGGGETLVTARRAGLAAAREVIWLGGDDGETEVRLVLGAACKLAGRVLDPDGRPVPGARVVVDAAIPGGVRAVSDREGRYRLEAVAAGQHWLSAARPGATLRAVVRVHLPSVERLDLVLLGTATLRGRVTDARTGNPIEGARVVAGTGNGWDEQRQSASAPTDAAGGYAIETLRPGRIMFVTVEKDGWIQAEPSDHRIRLEEAGGAVVDLEMLPAARIEGVVTGPDGPVVGAEVSAAGSDGVPGVTDLAGRYRLTPLRGGEVRVVVGAAGYAHPDGAETTVDVPAGGCVTHDIELVACGATGETVEYGETPPERTVVVRGRVLAADGASCAGCTVSVSSKSPYGSVVDRPVSWDLGNGTPVRPDGTFEVTVADPERTLEVVAAGPGFATGGPVEIEVTRGRDEYEAEVVLDRGHTLRVRVVTDGTGEPIAGAAASLVVPAEGGAHVDWANGPPPPVVHATSGPDGRLAVEHVPSGRYELRIGAPGHVDAAVETTLPRDEPVTVALAASLSLAGVVRYADGTAPGVVDLAFRPEGSEDSVRSCECDSMGRFVVRGLSAGRYVVAVARDFDNRANFLEGDVGPYEAGRTDVVVTVRRGRTIVGRVVAPDGTGVSRAFLRAVDGEGDWIGSARSTGDGSFEIVALPDGVYVVLVKANGFTPFSRDGVAAGARDVRLVLSRGKSISGTIVHEDGRPVAGVDVYAVSPGRGGYHDSDDPHARTDAEGRFALGGLARETYEVALAGDHREMLLLLDAARVPAGASGIRLVAGRGGTLTGRVVDQDGRPVPGAEVDADPATQGIARNDETDDDGRFSIDGLFPEVAYELEVEIEGYVRRSVSGVRAGGDPVEIRIVRGLEVTGRVLGPDGEPMREASLTLWPEDGRRVETETDGEGAFRARGLPPGRYHVHVLTSGPDDEILSFDGGVVEAGATDVVIRATRR